MRRNTIRLTLNIKRRKFVTRSLGVGAGEVVTQITKVHQAKLQMCATRLPPGRKLNNYTSHSKPRGLWLLAALIRARPSLDWPGAAPGAAHHVYVTSHVCVTDAFSVSPAPWSVQCQGCQYLRWCWALSSLYLLIVKPWPQTLSP